MTKPPRARAAGLAALTALSLDCAPRLATGPAIALVAKGAPVASSPVAPVPTAPMLPPGHVPIAEPRDVALPFVVQPVPGARSALLVSALGDERVAWVRRIDATGAVGPVLRFVDERVVGAFDRGDGPVIATSDGARICFVRPSRLDERSCVVSAPSAIVPVGARLALLEITTTRAHEPARVGKPKPPSPPSKTHTAKPKARAGAKKPAPHAGPTRKPSHPMAELFVRWVDEAGAIDAEAKPTGLHFEAPLDGLGLVDARARPPGVDVLWYETAPGRRTRSALGSGRIMAASLREDGALDLASRVAVVDADVAYGELNDHHAPRLAGDDLASAFLDLDAQGHCEATRVRPTLARLVPLQAACSVAPDRLASGLDAADVGSLERILADAPSRAEGQPRRDIGLVAWAGDRAFYERKGALRSASRLDGASRDEPAPFVAHRARIAWGAFTSDGEGVAFADGAVVHVDAQGAVRREVASGAVRSGVIGAVELGVDRRRVARIGATWWIARGERGRVWPDVATAPVTAGHPDASVLVGGREIGLAVAIDGGVLRVSSLSPHGDLAHLTSVAPSPVRIGLDACERVGGGAIVAGVSAADPTQVVAFTLDARGTVGDVRATPLRGRPGELAVRVTPLPAGGALLTDLARRRVVWLDDAARPVADAAWPMDESAAVCVDGRPARLVFPAPTPGELVRVPDVAADACVVGDPMWGHDGALRWFGATTAGVDSFATFASVRLAAPTPSPSPIEASPAPPIPAPPAPRCPADMVSIAGRFCVDRFEDTIVDARTGEPLSPDYPTTPNLLEHVVAEWATGRERVGNVHARAFPLPWIAPSRFGDKPEPIAVSRLGARPNGYVTGLVAEAACAAAGKRLCKLDEFVTACRGEGDTQFPYGDTYEDGACNVFREEHPAAMLHDNASVGHLDPRLNRVVSRGRPMLEKTGDSPACRSRWGSDAVYDMVGNLDEWIDEGGGAFAGGFYARATRAGCDAVVTAHPKSYLDYSTGVRCCKE